MSHEPGPLDRMPARRRQELALGAVAVAIVAALAAAAYLVFRLRRR